MVKPHINLKLYSKFISEQKITQKPNIIFNKKDNREEIIFLNEMNEIIALDLKGNVLRHKKIARKKIKPEHFFDIEPISFNSAKVVVQDLYETGEKNLLCILNNGELVCLDLDFNIIFIKAGEGEFVTEPDIIKLHDSEEKRILVGDNEHNIYLLDNKGEEVWKFKSQGQISSAIQTYKYFQKDFILFGCEDNHLYCLNYKGKLSWKYKTGGVITSRPLIEKFNGEIQETIVACSHDKTIYLLNFYGQLLDKKKTKGFITSNPTIIKDNKKDIKYLVAGTSSREQSVIFYNPFKKIKEIDFANRVTVQPTVINLMDQEKKYEYLMFSAHNHYIYFIDIMESISQLNNKFFKYNIPGLLVDKPKLIQSKLDNQNYLLCTNNKNEIIVKEIIL